LLSNFNLRTYTEGAAKADPGMPSSHAISLSYLSWYAAASIVIHGGGLSVVDPRLAVPGAVALAGPY